MTGRASRWWRRAGGAVLCVAGLTSCATPAIAKPTAMAIDYEVRRLPSAERYQITMRFRGDHNGRSTLTIPSAWAAATQAERGIEGLAVTTPHATLEDTDVPTVKQIVHRPDAMLTVRYRLKQIADGEPTVSDPAAMFLPTIRPRYFAWAGWTTWVIPMADNDRRVHVHVVFDDLPPGWAFASSFGLDPADVRFDGPMSRFQAALFIGGDFRLRSRSARGGSVITAVRGDWSFGDNAFADRVIKIVDGERAFWNDDSQRFYLTVLMPLAAPSGLKSSRGTGLTQAFVTNVTANVDLGDLDSLLTHEYFHHWNSPQLGQIAEPQPRLYWFSEGFSDYYMNVLQLRLGLESLARFAQAYDESIKFLAESPDGAAPNSKIVERFFTDGDTIGRLPYSRGMLLAAKWDAEIRAASGDRRSLDDAMRTLRDQHRRGVAMLDADRIVRVATALGVREAATDVDRQIERGELPRLTQSQLGPCMAIADATEPRVDIGFDLPGSTRSAELPIVGVDPGGPAYGAGLRNGQFLRAFTSIDRTRHLVEAQYAETVDGAITTIRYPALGRPITRQHVALRTDLGDETVAGCLASLGASLGASRAATLARDAGR